MIAVRYRWKVGKKQGREVEWMRSGREVKRDRKERFELKRLRKKLMSRL
jgi:hypothetical protein